MPKEKASGGRRISAKTLTFENIRKVHAYISNYATTHALVLPGRVPGFKRDDINLLPSSHTKVFVYNQYKKCAEESGMLALSMKNIYHYFILLMQVIVLLA